MLHLPLITIQLLTATIVVLSASIDDSGIKTDHNALLAIKSQLVDSRADGILASWNHSIQHCNWDGVICGNKHKRVIELDLYSRGLSGTISPFIGNLSFLDTIALYNNSLYGKIPPEIGRLFRLERLGLFNNTLVGEIPANLSGCSNLRILSLAWNKLQGHVPIELGALSNLQAIAFQQNNLTGPLFKVIQNITSLQVISAAYNAFTGTIPDSIADMKDLAMVALAENYFSGRIPPSLFNLSSLSDLDLTSNQFEGSIMSPDTHVNLPQIINLDLNLNKLTGPFPTPFLNLTNLVTLGLSMNKFTGSVSFDFRHFSNLFYLDLSDMNLRGDVSFVTTLANCSSIQTIQLQRNNFTGTLPESVTNFSKSLSSFSIGGNQISGEISAGFGSLTNLAFLFMYGNEFTGTIPDELGSLGKLEQLDLGSNKLTGRIPKSFGNLSRLSQLYLDDNRLQGSIPSHLGSSQNLLYLGLSQNELNGTVPNVLFGGSAKFLELDLSQNQLKGSLPLDIGDQINLVKFDVSENKFSGELPSGLGKCSALEQFRIEGNSIHGSIPSSYSSLMSLQTLDLSRNNLSGILPIYFSKFPLVYLNLSYNNFEGNVPEKGIYGNISAVSVVGNKGLCGGIPQLHLPRCMTEDKGKNRRRLSVVLKLTIPIICAVVGLLIMATWLYLARRRKKRDSIPSVLAMEKGLLKVSYSMLLKATDEFSSSNLLGAGTFGTVFKGIIDTKMVAIKVLKLQQQGASKSFMAECKVLRNTRHRNLVKIITVCSSTDFQRNDFKALVYDFMPKGSLDKWLHESGKLSLVQRMNIAIDVAHALNYLHHENDIPIVHCDLKPSNILLDDEMVAHVGDFGLAKFFAQPGFLNHSSSIGVQGTVGYAAPEYGLGSEASTEGDIYSYGTLLLELMTGKRPTNNMFEANFNLHMYAKEALPDQVLQIVDPTLEDKGFTEEVEDRRAIQDIAERRFECMVCMISVGVACSNHLPQDRMKINEAIRSLRAARDKLINVDRSQIH
ncbi:hypothetical protein KSS87_015615 [Heliosperma pusillum]|nr:hypothetical protein KSS87_015615 [Heliosperma pusillum]